MVQVDRRGRILTPRLVGIAGVLVTLALIAVFMSMPFLVSREPAAAGDYRLGGLTVASDVTVFQNGTYVLTLTLTDEQGRLADAEALSAAAQMPGMGASPVELNRVSTGLYRGTGLFSMPGSWVFTLRTGEASVEIPAGPSGSSF